jgi:PAS domain S-box-containing protein
MKHYEVDHQEERRREVRRRGERRGEDRRAGETRDALSRKRKEELREAALMFESVIRESPLAIDVFDHEDKIIIWNPAAERLLGWSAEEVLGRPLPMIPDETRREIEIVHAATLEGDGFTGVETRLRRKDGELIDISLSTAPFYDGYGQINGAMAVLVDISDRKRAEEVLGFLSRISTEITRSLTVLPILNRLAELMLPTLGDFVAIDLRDEDGRPRRVASLHVDPAMAEVVAELQRYPPIEPRRREATAAWQEEQPTILYEVIDSWLVHSASSVEHLRLMRRLAPRSILTVPLTARDRALGTITLALTRPGRSYGLRDLELAQEVARRASTAIENAQLYEKTEAAVRARDEVMAIVSHDLRNPINTITMTTDLLREQLPEEDTMRLLEIIGRSTDRMERLIRDLLDVARIEAGGLTIERRPVDPAEVVREAVDFQQPLARESGVSLDVETPEPLPTLEADRERLLQVFQNLIDNALKFTPEGGRVTVRAEEGPGEVRFSVNDTGPGIDPKQLPHLFDRFWQARKGARVGAGLGLAIARGIVEAHGGKITAASTPGKGTTITFSIPVHPAEPRQRAE